MSNRNAQFEYQQHQRSIQRTIRSVDAMDFVNALTEPALLEVAEAHLPVHRERWYSPTVTLSMFMGQAMQADGSCQHAVNAWAVRREVEGLSECSSRTGAYCKARQRLTVQIVQELTRTSGRMLSGRRRVGAGTVGRSSWSMGPGFRFPIRKTTKEFSHGRTPKQQGWAFRSPASWV